MKLDNSTQVFLLLLRAGLWENENIILDGNILIFEEIRWDDIYVLAEEQSVLGLVTVGLERMRNPMVPKEVSLQFIGSILQLEQKNIAMNRFVAYLIDYLRDKNVYTLLVKGQGIAQCYERPLWRSSGDVDLFLSETNYRQASRLLLEKATAIENEKKNKKHLGMTIDGWSVELHGALRSGLWKGLDSELDKVQGDVLLGGKVRSWMDGQTQVFLPAPDEDVVFVFSHILQHFFKEGIGLRQICDWCRLLWTFRDILDLRLLEQRIHKMGVMTEWKAFGSLAVDYLGIPIGAMPFYDKRFKGKGTKVMEFILKTGNFGHNRDYSYRQNHSYIVYKAISMGKHIQDFGRYFVIFPLDAIKVTWNRMILGFMVAIKGKSHE